VSFIPQSVKYLFQLEDHMMEVEEEERSSELIVSS
jgi:hypothetical protein